MEKVVKVFILTIWIVYIQVRTFFIWTIVIVLENVNLDFADSDWFAAVNWSVRAKGK